MTVKELKEILEDYSDDAKVIVVDWSIGLGYEPTIGGDDLDEGAEYCRIGFE